MSAFRLIFALNGSINNPDVLILYIFQVTGDNVRSLALCDFTGDGKNEVTHAAY